MATPANPLKPSGTTPSTMDLLVGGLPAAQSGQAQSALAQMLGPGAGLGGYLRMAGPEYADQIDELEWNPMASWY